MFEEALNILIIMKLLGR